MKKIIILYILIISNIVFGQDSPFKGFLPPRMTTLQRNAIQTPAPGLMIYNVTEHCMENWNNSIWVSKCTTLALNCTGATHNGTLTSGISASGTSSVISYTGGNGNFHNGQTVTSTGVTGLTATLAPGSFANGAGSLTYTITGTPSAAGTASFAVSIGGKTCTLTRNVIQGIPPIDTGASCNGFTLPSRTSGNYSFTLNGKSVTASFTTVNASSTGSTTTGLMPSLLTGEYHNGYPVEESKSNGMIRIKFSRPITNFKVDEKATTITEKYIYTFKKNGVTVKPTMISIVGASSNVNTSTYTITGTAPHGGSPSNFKYVIGAQWFDEVEIQGTQLGVIQKATYPPPRPLIYSPLTAAKGSLFNFCVGAAL